MVVGRTQIYNLLKRVRDGEMSCLTRDWYHRGRTPLLDSTDLIEIVDNLKDKDGSTLGTTEIKDFMKEEVELASVGITRLQPPVNAM